MMSIYIYVFTFSIVINTYVFAISIHNFKPINMSDLKIMIGPQAGLLLRPLARVMPKDKSDEASEEIAPRPPPILRDEQKNIFFDLWVVKGRENRLMGDNSGKLCVSIQVSPEVQDSLNMELWRFISNILQVRREEVEVVMSETNDMARRIVVKCRAITERECQQRIQANMKAFSLEIFQETGAEESAKLDNLFFHTEIKSEFPTGPVPETSAEDIHQDWKPNYVKNPTILDKVLRDLKPNEEIIIRGRLLKKDCPNFIARPLLEDYQGRKSLKLKRKILEGFHNNEIERKADFPAGPRLSCPERISGLSVIDTLSEDGARVVSRRVFAPLFQNRTHDFVDELDYTEVDFKPSI